jgi:hypothetical protein
MQVFVDGQRLDIAPRDAIGKGGEADIYAIGRDLVLKLFKRPDHPDLSAFPSQQCEAAKRLAVHQHKLPAFPTPLPDRVVAPIGLATDHQAKQILGYTMRRLQNADLLMRYGDLNFRQQGAGATAVSAIFQDLHTTVSQLHAMDVIIGDFNDLNILVQQQHAFLIDADSFQFGPFRCQVYTERFIDPLLCEPNAIRPLPIQPYVKDSDWYAFAVMLFRSLLLVDPYGGVHKPKSPSQHLPHSARPLHRITVFDPAVRYPKPAYRYDILPDALLHYFYHVFTQDQRQPFPRLLLDNLSWITCPQCHLEHARPSCPACSGASTAVVRPAVCVRGQVSAQQTVKVAAGRLVSATTVNGALYYLVHSGDTFRRDGHGKTFSGQLRPPMVLRLLPKQTLVGQGNQLLVMSNDDTVQQLQVDTCDGRPLFDANDTTYFWLQDGQLMRAGALGAERIGDVLSGQTRFWVGAKLGFGFYRAGDVQVAFVFDPQHRGINDNVRLPAIHGQLVDVSCQLANDRAWLIWSVKEGARIVHHAAVILSSGEVIATSSAPADTAAWMASAGGALAVGQALLAPTDDGMVRLDVEGGQIVQSKTFPDTEPYIDSASRLLDGPNGIYVVGERTIHLLSMQPD